MNPEQPRAQAELKASSTLPTSVEVESPLNTSFLPEKPIEPSPKPETPEPSEKTAFSPIGHIQNRWNQLSAGDKASVAVFATLATVEAAFFVAKLGGITAPFHAGLLTMDLALLAYHFTKPLSRET